VKFLKELKLTPGDGDYKPGDQVLVNQFVVNEKVDVIGVSKGRGYTGLIKRHHFKGGPGSARFDVSPRARIHRASSFPSRVFPGMKMSGTRVRTM